MNSVGFMIDLEVKEVPEMPDPALSVQDMKDYGYAWAGILPAGQEAAEKALEMGCEVYRLYSDNTEGLCVDAKEIADHAATLFWQSPTGETARGYREDGYLPEAFINMLALLGWL